MYDGHAGDPCFKQVASGVDPTIEFPAGKLPHVLAIGSLFLKMMEGNVEQISGGTMGMHYRDSIIGELTIKFGPPTSKGTEGFDPHGIALTGSYVVWQRPGYRVTYHSIDNGDIEHGSIEVSSDKFLAVQQIRQDKVESGRVGL